jgi:hypothetical protein
MALSTAIIANAALAAMALGALAIVCRLSFRLGVNRAEPRTSSQRPQQHGREHRAGRTAHDSR